MIVTGVITYSFKDYAKDVEDFLSCSLFYIFDTDCQQKAGPSAWTPFHESASAVTQLYKGMYFRE